MIVIIIIKKTNSQISQFMILVFMDLIIVKKYWGKQAIFGLFKP